MPVIAVGMKPSHLRLLKELAMLGTVDSRISVSSAELGKIVGMSQQSAARILRELRDGGFLDINRGRRSWVLITEKGRDALLQEYSDYRAIFGDFEPVIRGTVESGLGEGRYYLSKEGYVKQIEELLGFKPYPGTLNVRLEHSEMAKMRSFLGSAVTIRGFLSEGRTFGDVLAVKSAVSGMDCAVITPRRSHYSDVVELISPVKLRDVLKLRDGDVVEIILH